MSTIVVTAAEVFSDSDNERACAAIARRGGGAYAVKDLHLGVDLDMQGDYDSAVVAAQAVADAVDNAPVTKEDRVAISRQLQAANAAAAQAQADADAAAARAAAAQAQADQQLIGLKAQQAQIDSLTAQLAIAVAQAAATPAALDVKAAG